MKKDTLILLIAIALTWFVMWFFGNDSDIKKQLKESEEIREQLVERAEKLVLRIDSLKQVKQKVEYKYIYLDKQNKQKDEEIKDNVNGVYTLNERQLDSTIRGWRHIEN